MALAAANDALTKGDPVAARQRRRQRRRWIFRGALLAAALAWTAMAAWHRFKPVPPGTDIASPWSEVPLGDLKLLTDVTVTDGRGQVIIRQQIFDEVLRIIDGAQEFVVLNWCLLDERRRSDGTDAPLVRRALSDELTERLLARRAARPELRILFITDPLTDFYGDAPSAHLEALRTAGVAVVVTDLDRLRDPNLLYSAFWRLAIKWWLGDPQGAGSIANPLETGPATVSLPARLRLLNFKANHRKLIVADDGAGKLVALVTSADPHDAASAHSNIGLRFSGGAAAAALASELEVARFSGWSGDWEMAPSSSTEDALNVARLRLLSERAIKDSLASAIRTAEAGESILIASLHLADRDIVDELIDAAAHGVRVRLILDPNKDALGRTRDGVPNRPVAAELRRRSGGKIEVRWYRTHGELFRAKLALVQRADSFYALLGSADFTRRSIGGFNLEIDIALEAGRATPLAQQLSNYFETLWQNDPASMLEYTTDFATYEDQSFTRYWRYRMMEATGLSAF
jgi:hypothetical protein